MKRLIPPALAIFSILSIHAAPPTLTIYNGDFGLVRETIALDLHEGENDIRYTDVTSQLDSGTVIFRDPSGKAELNVIEQKFRSLPIGTSAMLRLFEGQTIDFIVPQ